LFIGLLHPFLGSAKPRAFHRKSLSFPLIYCCLVQISLPVWLFRMFSPLSANL
jgi:hypothetical protein